MKAKDIQPRTAASVNEEVLETWKKAYPRGVFRIGVDTDDILEVKEEIDEKRKKRLVTIYVQKVGYFRKPTRQEISAAMTLQNDPLGQAEDIMRSCWLGGDEELLDDDDYFQAALMQYQEAIEIRTGEIKKV